MKSRGVSLWLAAVAMAAGSITWVTSPAAAAGDVQVVVHGDGCGDPLVADALSEQGKLLSSRPIVRGKRDIAMEAYATDPDGKRLIFSTYNCTTKAHALYTQPLAAKPTATQLLSLPVGSWLLDATWDVARRAPAVLYRDANFTYYLQVFSAGSWVTLWTGTRASMGGYFLEGIEGQSGREYLLFGDNFNDWQIWRVSGEGRVWSEMTGPGELTNVEGDAFGAVNAITGRDGSWICDGFAKGKISDAITQGKCVTIPGGAAYGAVFTDADNVYSWWVNMTGAIAPDFMIKVTCVGGSFLSCGTPAVSTRRPSPLTGTSVNMASVELPSLKLFSRIGASTV